MEQKHVNMMKHAWGFSSSTPGYRTHYCTQVDDPDMLLLTELGLFQGPQYVGQVGEGCGMFYLTDEGLKLMKEYHELRMSVQPNTTDDSDTGPVTKN